MWLTLTLKERGTNYKECPYSMMSIINVYWNFNATFFYSFNNYKLKPQDGVCMYILVTNFPNNIHWRNAVVSDVEELFKQ